MRSFKHKVFISHSHKNAAFVAKLVAMLQQNHISYWIDSKIKLGDSDWEKTIRTAIRDAEFVLYIGSEEAFDSNYVRSEIDIAHEYEIPIIPIWASGTSAAACFPMSILATAQRTDMRDQKYEKGIAELLKILNDSPKTMNSLDISSVYLEREIQIIAEETTFSPMLENAKRNLLYSKTDEEVRQSVLRINNMRGPQATSLLFSIAINDSNKYSIWAQSCAVSSFVQRVSHILDYDDPPIAINDLVSCLVALLNCPSLFNKNNIEMRIQAIWALQKFGGQQAVDALISEFYRRLPDGVMKAVTKALSSRELLGERVFSVAEMLAQHIFQADIELKIVLADALINLQEPVCLSYLENEFRDVIGTKDNAKSVRLAMARAIASFGDLSIPIFSQALNDDYVEIREMAARQLYDQGTIDALDALRQASKIEENQNLRRTILEYVKSIENLPKGDETFFTDQLRAFVSKVKSLLNRR